MKLPYIIKKELTAEERTHWDTFYKSPTSAFNRATEEGLWRRTQHQENAAQSGWTNNEDARRRIVHYEHSFNTLSQPDGTTALALVDTYLWLHLTLPSSEITAYRSILGAELQDHHWKTDDNDKNFFRNGDLSIRLIVKDSEEQDHAAGRKFPTDYGVLEICVAGPHNQKTHDFKEKPWSVLKTGIRQKERREDPVVENALDEMIKYFPAQVELGCGASIEAGVPPLHFLHEVYCVTDTKTGNFILDVSKDNLIFSIVRDPDSAFERFTAMYKKCFEAQPTGFHRLLRKLHDDGHIIGPIITNNFDGLAEKSGLKETYVRRYDETNIVPHIDFEPNARSLLVVGAHADRRKIQQAARNQGLKVLFIDPEGYQNPDGTFTPYPLESPKNEDILYRQTATKGLEEIAKKIGMRDNASPSTTIPHPPTKR